RDLEAMRDEINRPFLLLFDEADILSQDKSNLEKIRNIFTNLRGFMLILAGTPNLFPVMDLVFSPISRQFKKIFIQGFGNQRETLECIQKPLKKIGISSDLI